MENHSNKSTSTNLINVFIEFLTEPIFVGKLLLENKKVFFKYDEDFIKLGMNLSPFRLKYNSEIQIAPLDPFHGLFGLFSDSLPDGWGLLLLNRALSKLGLTLNDISVLDQLAYVGESGKGAMIYRPVKEIGLKEQSELNLDQLKTDMDEVYSGNDVDVIDKLMNLGGSSGGARPKANVGYNSLTNQLIHGHDFLPVGFEHWIIKFPNAEDPLDIANIEYAYYKMATTAGIEMSECRLLNSKKGLQIFATKRFDREGNNRIHMHSMAGLTHDNFRMSSIDYGHIIDIAYRLERSVKSRETVFRLAAFNVYSHNRDDHSKNFSWLMNSKGEWKFSPAYDLTYSSTSIDEHATRIAGEGANPGRKNLLELAKEFNIQNAEIIINQVQEAIAEWSTIAAKCGVSKSSISIIQKKLKQLKD